MNETLKSYRIDEITVGQKASLSKIITDEHVRKYADLSGDINPVHLDESYAKQSRFRKRIAHGMLSAGLFSSIFGTKLPGEGCVYVSQNLNFKRPVYIGDSVIATVTVQAINSVTQKVLFDTICTVMNKKVIVGSAEIFIP
jgi:3-hydroxybutyryl-CoA dehydratase